MRAIQPETYSFSDGPNNKKLPVLIYRGVLADESDKAKAFEKKYEQNGWKGSWQDTIYTYAHFHSNAHEALGIAKGDVTVQLGGENGEIFDLTGGDMIVLPAGTVHRRVSKNKVTVVGAYPKGQEDYNMNKDVKSPAHDKDIGKVPHPETDPLFGRTGPLVKLWTTIPE